MGSGGERGLGGPRVAVSPDVTPPRSPARRWRRPGCRTSCGRWGWIWGPRASPSRPCTSGRLGGATPRSRCSAGRPGCRWWPSWGHGPPAGTAALRDSAASGTGCRHSPPPHPTAVPMEGTTGTRTGGKVTAKPPEEGDTHTLDDEVDLGLGDLAARPHHLADVAAGVLARHRAQLDAGARELHPVPVRLCGDKGTRRWHGPGRGGHAGDTAGLGGPYLSAPPRSKKARARSLSGTSTRCGGCPSWS